MATCLSGSDPHASSSTLAVIKKFNPTVCQIVRATEIEVPRRARVEVCGGLAFRRCPADLNGLDGICVSVRMQVIMCVHNSLGIEMRKEQIRLRIGAPCNFSEEAWLGCV